MSITCSFNATLIAGTLLWGFTSNAYAIDADYDVRSGDLVAPGAVGIVLHGVYAPSGTSAARGDDGVRSGYHVLQFSPAVTWGITPNTDFEVQLFTSAGPRGEYRLGGVKAELGYVPIKPASPVDDGHWLGVAVEIGRFPRTLTTADLQGAVTGLVGLRRARWTLSFNPGVSFRISGPGGEGRPELGVKAKVGFGVTDTWVLGLEHYTSLGALGHLSASSRQPQHTFLVLDVAARPGQLNFGVGRGHNAVSERWIVKAVLGIPWAKSR